MMKSVKRKRKESSSDSDDNQGPILVNKTFKVKDNGHDIIDFEVRNKLRTINAKPDTYFKYLVKKVEPQLETIEVDHSQHSESKNN